MKITSRPDLFVHIVKRRILPAVLCLTCLSTVSWSQVRLPGWDSGRIDTRLYGTRWPAKWISIPDMAENSYTVCHFRKTFSLDSIPEDFIVHVSADNRFKLYVNGHFVGLGPTYGDVCNWNYTTFDLAPYMHEGDNTIAAVVWNFASSAPLAQMSFGKTGFILQGNTAAEDFVNTGGSWKCLRNTAYSPYTRPVSGYYAAGACEQFYAADYPWGWEAIEYDDSGWPQAREIITGAAKGARDYPGWQLVPAPIQHVEMEPFRLQSLRMGSGVEIPEEFPSHPAEFTVPAGTKATILLDNSVLTTGYPTVKFSGGAGAEIEIGYAEALYKEGSRSDKGDRDETEGKHFIGYADRIIADGGQGREFTPLWWRTWRYIRLDITTGDEPLTVDDLYAVTSMYPLRRESEFNAPELPDTGPILETGWRTARLCANETYMDCPYYEQLQYFGDTRIQAMITMYNTRNDEMVRNALEQGLRSMTPDGITMSRYPSSLHQFIPPFSLWWICSGHDYWMYRGDEAYLKSLLPAYRTVLAWFESYLKPDMSLGYIPFWCFMDWCGTPDGEPVREKDGNSAVLDLQYMLALSAAAEMEEAFGMKEMGRHYRTILETMRDGVAAKYWDSRRELFADTHDHRSFSQHANVLAILAGVISGDEATALFDRLTEDSSLIQCTVYFRYYLFQAMKKAGRGDRLTEELQLWRDQLALGLTTWAEQPEPSRSDCHAWSASLNVEFFRILLGIDSDAPGFSKIRIAPALGGLTEASGSIPHPAGTISADYHVSRTGRLTAEISLPEGTSGTFVWKGSEYRLKAGGNSIKIPADSIR